MKRDSMKQGENENKQPHIIDGMNINSGECEVEGGKPKQFTPEDYDNLNYIDNSPNLTDKGKGIRKREYIAKVLVLNALSGFPVNSAKRVLDDCHNLIMERSIFTNR